MPCHLIVAHSNSWSSDTDKWTCVIILDFFVTSHSVKMASAQHVPKNKQALLLSPPSISPYCHSNPCAALATTHLLRKGTHPRSLSLDLWYPSPIVPLPTVSLRKKWKSKEWRRERMCTFSTFQAVELRKKNISSLKSSWVWHFPFYLFNLFIVSNH